MLPSKVVQQSPKGIVLPTESIFPPIVTATNTRLPPKPPNVNRTTTSQDPGPDPNMDVEENSPHQEGIISENYIAPDQSYLEQPQELIELVNTSKLVQRHLP